VGEPGDIEDGGDWQKRPRDSLDRELAEILPAIPDDEPGTDRDHRAMGVVGVVAKPVGWKPAEKRPEGGGQSGKCEGDDTPDDWRNARLGGICDLLGGR